MDFWDFPSQRRLRRDFRREFTFHMKKWWHPVAGQSQPFMGIEGTQRHPPKKQAPNKAAFI